MNYPSLASVQLQQTGAINGQPIALKQGQVIHGMIKQLYPDQMAEVQIGGQRLMAKLEIPLQTGNAHYFQVSGVEPDLQLKVISGPMSPTGTMAQQVSQLLNSLQLPETNEMKQIASYFLKNNLPITKEQMKQAEQILKTLPDTVQSKEALNILQKLIELKIPIQQNTFQSVLQGSMKQGFTELLGSLQRLLQHDDTISQVMREQLLNQLQMVSNPLALETGGVLLAKMIDILSAATSSLSDRLAILQLLKEVGIIPKNANLSNWSTSVLQQSNNNHLLQQLSSQIQAGNIKEASVSLPLMKDLLQQNLLLSDAQKLTLQQSITKAITQPSSQNSQAVVKDIQKTLQQMMRAPGQMLNTLYSASPKDISELLPHIKSGIQEQSLLSARQKEGLLQMLEKFEAAKITQQSIQYLAKDLHSQLLKAFGETTKLQPFQTDANGVTAKQQMMQLLNGDLNNEQLFAKVMQRTMHSQSQVLQQILTQTEQQLAQRLDSKAFEIAIKETLQNLGLSYEAKLIDKSADIQQITNQLKPQLLGLLQDDSVSNSTKNVAEQVVARINGMQYLSGENGPQHQLMMQVPLEFFGKKTEATLQWNGRMKKDGKIDADYARILFYLQLSSIQETVIDMQVQSRVVTVTIYNENQDLKILAEPLKMALKTGLSQHDYQLSGVIIRKYSKKDSHENTQKSSTSDGLTKGVDIRI